MVRPNPLHKERLLKELDQLGYSDRVKRIAALGRQHLGSLEYSRLLLSLLEGGAYEARLALMGAIATLDVPVILAGLKHPKASIRNTAAGLAPQVASAEEIERELPGLAPDCRRKLLRTVALMNRLELAERLLPEVQARWGAGEAAIVLQACSAATVRARLTELGYAIIDWKKLASRHLKVVADYFTRELEAAPLRAKDQVWSRFSSAMEYLCNHKPDLVLACALNHSPADKLPSALKAHLGILMRQRPDAVYELLIRTETCGELLTFGVPEAVLKRAKLLTMDQWKQLAKLLADQPVHVARMLEHLAPSWRGEIFEAVYEAEKRRERVFPERLLYVLPHALRDQEAARLLGLREIRENRERTLRITAARSIHQVRDQLEEATRVSSADERATALMQLIRSTVLSRQGMDVTLLTLGRIRNDQDPVRGAVFKALSESPASVYEAAHIPALAELVDSVIDARDTSYGTRYSVQQLAFSILRHQAAEPDGELFRFALSTLQKLAKQDGQLSLPSMEKNMPKGVEEIIFEGIYSYAAQAGKRENYNLVLSLAGSFGKRGYGIVKLQQLLREAAKAKTEATAIRAARLWLAPLQTRDERVRELLDADPSYITIYEVFRHLHLKRQEWLDPYISEAAIKGKFLSGKTVYLVPASDGFYRWLPRQQQAYGSLLSKVATGSKYSLFERSRAIRIMAGMPDWNPELLYGLVQDKEVAVAEAALHALSLLEEPEQALPALLEHLDSDRARVAMYSVPRCIRRVSPALLSAMLKELLDREKLKITVRKEAIRLLGAYRNEDSLPLLLKEYTKPKAHKDVIIAIGHAARGLLDDERSWELLGAVASSPQPDIAVSLLSQQPDALPANYRPRYLDLIIAIAQHPDVFVRRQAYSTMARWTNGYESVVAAAAAEGMLDLEDSTSWEFAMMTIIEAARDGKVNAVVAGICRELAAAAVRQEWNAAADRDLPHRQRLQVLIKQLTSLPISTRVQLSSLYLELIGILAADETQLRLVLKLYIAVLDWNNTEEASGCLNRMAQGIASQPMLLGEVYSEVTGTLEQSAGYWTPEALLELVDVLRDEPNYEALFLGLPLLEAAGRALHWGPEAAERLRWYRTCSHAAVRSQALNIWTAQESALFLH
ncbi:HEAT repeat domain-containing protein [Paenibacillus piscarius]|uniref:HEAT repeat domain-containing protein n=1 Tax=Paenibacillus piscarius TaxID=1089681 RepID=UPI001EE7DC53|nr:HEAT repeat domain-containing protein [Paenibacillus piscarius]